MGFKFNPFTGNLDLVSLAGPQGPTGPAGGVNSVNSKQGDVSLEPSDIQNGPSNTIAAFDNSGILTSLPGVSVDADTGVIDQGITLQPNNNGSATLNNINLTFEPLQNSPNDTFTVQSLAAHFDNASSGFDQGTSGSALNVNNLFVEHHGTGDIGTIYMTNNYMDLGNGTDPINVKGFSYSAGFADIESNVTINGQVQGYLFQPNFHTSSTIEVDNADITGFADYTNVNITQNSHSSFTANPTIFEIRNGHNYTGLNIAPSITTLTGNAGFTGVGIYPNITDVGVPGDGSFTGMQISPHITNNHNYSVGLNVDMTQVSNSPGAAASVTVQDLTYTFNEHRSDDNSFTIQYLTGGTAGSETVAVSGSNITIHIESGVSTATQIQQAVEQNPTAGGAVTVTVTGTGSNTQISNSPQSFAGGINAGSKQAAHFQGDVQIDGALSFTGALSLSTINAYGPVDVATFTSGVNSINGFITAPALAANQTHSDSDLLGINTAMLLTIGDNSSITTNFLGMNALGLPAVVSMGTGATLDVAGGAVFAISLDTGATGGTINQVNLCRTLALPNGITTVNNLYGYKMDLPFGDPATNTWGLYVSPATAHNYMAGDLKVGGLADKVDAGYALHVVGDTKIVSGATALINATSVGLGFFGSSPAAKQTSAGAQTAGALYTSTEQLMIQQMYNALRTYGLLT